MTHDFRCFVQILDLIPLKPLFLAGGGGIGGGGIPLDLPRIQEGSFKGFGDEKKPSPPFKGKDLGGIFPGLGIVVFYPWFVSPLTKKIPFVNGLFMAYKQGILSTYDTSDDPPRLVYITEPWNQRHCIYETSLYTLGPAKTLVLLRVNRVPFIRMNRSFKSILPTATGFKHASGYLISIL